MKISKDPNVNWNNNQIQFPRLIAEIESMGGFNNEELIKELMVTTDLTREQIFEIVDRAQKTWDDIKAKI